MTKSASTPPPPARGLSSLWGAWPFVLGFVLCFTVLSLGWPWTGFALELPPVGSWWGEFTEWGRYHLPSVRPDSSVSFILAPTIFVIAWAGTMLLLFDKPPDWVRLPVGLVFLVLQAGYLGFRLVATLNLDTVANATFGILFLLAEAYVHFRIALSNLLLLRLTHRTPQADQSALLVRSGEYLPTVDVFVPTYSEPVEMLERTIIGCQAMEYPHKTIWLLDDQRRPAMRALAQRLGCRYLDRPDNSHAKAGNLNHALEHSDSELVLCFDADFIPTRDFLARTVGFFRDQQVAMVQTPQNFFNEDAIQRNLGLQTILEDEQRLFFRTLQPGRDAMNAIVCHGTCWVGRRSALAAIGNIPTETLTEDWATSIKLQAAGYKLLYLNEALSAGLSADTCGEFVQQRSRWAQGTIQSLFASTNPATVPGLNWRQRLMHFSGILYFTGSLCSLFVLLVPLLYLFFGVFILQMTIPEMIFYRLPFAVGYYMLYSWLTLRTRSALWTEFYDTFLAPSLGLTALRTLFKPFGRGFRVTDKTQRPRHVTMNRRVAMPFIVLIGLYVVGLAFAMAVGRHVDHPEIFPLVAYYTLTTFAVLWVCLLVAIDIPRTREFPRFEHRVPFELTWNDQVVRGETSFMSESDAAIAGRFFTSRPPEHAVLSLPSLAMADVPVRLRKDADGQWALEFVELSLPQRRSLISFLYCEPGRWETPCRGELRATWEYARAGVRMFPLAESR